MTCSVSNRLGTNTCCLMHASLETAHYKISRIQRSVFAPILSSRSKVRVGNSAPFQIPRPPYANPRKHRSKPINCHTIFPNFFPPDGSLLGLPSCSFLFPVASCSSQWRYPYSLQRGTRLCSAIRSMTPSQQSLYPIPRRLPLQSSDTPYKSRSCVHGA